MKMAEIKDQVASLVAAIDAAIEDWQEQMDMWSQKPAHRLDESPKFEQGFWDKLHSLRGLAPEQAERYDWLLGLEY
jgi:hypothetical protein